MFITAICPTFRKPDALANALALWNWQDHPADQRHLIILDDDPTFDSQRGDNWSLHAFPDRFPTLGAKYDWLWRNAPPESEGFLVWDDDDIYLPGYVSAHAWTLEKYECSHPIQNWVFAGGRVYSESNGFHSALGVRRSLMERAGGYVTEATTDFDFKTVARMLKAARSIGEPWTTFDEAQYIMGFSTGWPHSSCQINNSDGEFYESAAHGFPKVPFRGRLVAKLDPGIEKVAKDKMQCS